MEVTTLRHQGKFPKEAFRENDTPKKIRHLQFGLFGPSNHKRLSHLEVVNSELYEHPRRTPIVYGCLDPRLGALDKSSTCSTCNQKLADCAGHFGHVLLELPVFHIGYFKNILQLLQIICKSCSRLLLSENDHAVYLRKQRNSSIELHQKRLVTKQVVEKCKKASAQTCCWCGAVNGSVKKIGSLKIIHEKHRPGKHIDEAEQFYAQFESAMSFNKDIKAHLSKAQEDLNPLVVLNLFKNISDEDCEVIDLDWKTCRPEHLIMQSILVPPVCIRPSVCMDASQGSNEDDITMKLTEIIHINNVVKDAMEKGMPINKLMEDWDFLQLQCAMYINSELPGVPSQFSSNKPLRGFCQRMKGKGGRFRGNLSGKRVNFSSRTVISPDPNLRIDQVGVPMGVAMILSFPERVNDQNIAKLRKLVINGPTLHPGANFVERKDGEKTFLKYGNRKLIAKSLRVGDVVERHLENGDTVLFNRQPSLHKVSIMAHKAVVLQGRTFRFNECVCAPYNADFDGDEMNLHLPQTEEARAESATLMSVINNLITPRNGEPLVAATQDFLTASYLISHKDAFFDRSQFAMMCSFITDAEERVDMPPPAMMKPIELWTGKQVFSVLMRPNKRSNVLVNLQNKGRTYSGGTIYDMCPKDGWVVIRNSELLCGVMDKASLGGGSKTSVFHVIMRDYSPDVAANRMWRLAKLCARFIGEYGFSIGASDVEPSRELAKKKGELVLKGYAQCDVYIAQFQTGDLTPQPGCNLEETLESLCTGELSDIRQRAGEMCIQQLHPRNAPLIMALCGSKGSTMNLSQMIACVGQQTVSGSRIPNGFINRTLPHFDINDKIPAAKGFVKNSFFSGMTPPEYFFHTMGGREGLVDTAVKTAETGYMQRRLMKSLEDLSVHYDNTVRSSVNTIVQFLYGDDGLDPANMEAKDRPVNFVREFDHMKSMHPFPEEESLDGDAITEYVEKVISSQKNDPTMILFLKEIKEFFLGNDESPGYVADLQRVAAQFSWLNEDDDAEDVSFFRATTNSTKTKGSVARSPLAHTVDCLHRTTSSQLDLFLTSCFLKFRQSQVEPGTAVGAIGAQSIGEPGTQMTLKTFHFAGVASMNITLGVPRIKEIINASKIISTPIITAVLVTDDDVKSARIVKGRIEKTTLGEIAEYIREVYSPDGCHLSVRLDMDAITALQLDLTANDVIDAILSSKLKVKSNHVRAVSQDHILIATADRSKEKMFYALQTMKNALPGVIVKGVPQVGRAVINTMSTEGDKKKYNLLVEGHGLGLVMATSGIDGTHTTSNHIMEVIDTLGIEAARVTIMNEIQYTMGEHGMSIDVRHVMLLADVMTYKGEVLGITRFGVAKMKDSVLMLASFEMTTDHLFEAASHGRSDAVDGVSECIIMGMPIPLGTGLFKVLHKPSLPTQARKTKLRNLLLQPKAMKLLGS